MFAHHTFWCSYFVARERERSRNGWACNRHRFVLPLTRSSCFSACAPNENDNIIMEVNANTHSLSAQSKKEFGRERGKFSTNFDQARTIITCFASAQNKARNMFTQIGMLLGVFTRCLSCFFLLLSRHC